MNFFTLIGIAVSLFFGYVFIAGIVEYIYEHYRLSVIRKNLNNQIRNLMQIENNIRNIYDLMRFPSHFVQQLSLDKIKKIREARVKLNQRLMSDIKVITDPFQIPNDVLEDEYKRIMMNLDTFDKELYDYAVNGMTDIEKELIK